jgi:hypothetical protein
MFIGSRSIRGVGVFAFALLGSAVFAHTPEQPPHQRSGDEVRQGFHVS